MSTMQSKIYFQVDLLTEMDKHQVLQVHQMVEKKSLSLLQSLVVRLRSNSRRESKDGDKTRSDANPIRRSSKASSMV